MRDMYHKLHTYVTLFVNDEAKRSLGRVMHRQEGDTKIYLT